MLLLVTHNTVVGHSISTALKVLQNRLLLVYIDRGRRGGRTLEEYTNYGT